MGIEWDGKRYEIDKLDEPINGGDAFLMCSDGFWDWILEKDMEKALKKFPNAMDCGDYLVQKALKRGMGKNMDNFSLIIVRV
jgi:serine/threonine protein phosphatase PrpC